MAGVGAIMGLWLGISGHLPGPTIDIHWSTLGPSEEGGSATADDGNGSEVVFLYIGAESCGWSNVDGLRDAVVRMADALRDEVDSQGKRFVTIGIARDISIEDGLRHLRRVGPFDEVISGRGWLNTGLIKYIYGDIPGPAATPQVVLIERTVHRLAGQTRVGSEQVIGRFVGAKEILEWRGDALSNGAR